MVEENDAVLLDILFCLGVSQCFYDETSANFVFGIRNGLQYFCHKSNQPLTIPAPNFFDLPKLNSKGILIQDVIGL